MRFLIVLCLAALPASAEYRSIEMRVSGLDCASCAASVKLKLRRIRGVLSAEFRTADSIAAMQLATANKVTLDQVRDVLKGMGYTPEDARVEARGELISDSGEWRLKLTGSDQVLDLQLPAHPGILNQIRQRAGTPVVIDGEVVARKAPSDPEVLKVSAVRGPD